MNKKIIYIFIIALLILFVVFFTWYFMRDAPVVTHPDTSQGTLDFTPYPYECFDLQTNAPLNGGQMTIEIQSR